MYTNTRNEWEEEGKIALIKETYTRTRNFVPMLTYTPHRRITKTRTNTLATHTHTFIHHEHRGSRVHGESG